MLVVQHFGVRNVCLAGASTSCILRSVTDCFQVFAFCTAQKVISIDCNLESGNRLFLFAVFAEGGAVWRLIGSRVSP